MGAAYSIVLERPIDGLNTIVDGKFLAQKAEARLDAIAIGVGSASNFRVYSALTSGSRMLTLCGGEGIEVADMELPPR